MPASWSVWKPNAQTYWLHIAGLEQQQRQLDEMLENLAAGRRADPADVAAFRHALSSAGIAHDLLTDLVEIADPSWQAAVEAVLAPLRTSCCWPETRMPKRRWRWAKNCATAISSCRSAAQPGLAPQGSLLEVVRFSQPVPEWLMRLLERIRRVEDASAGAKLPRGEDWITRQGFLRERRGGRFAAPEQARFGNARLESLRQQRAELEKALAPLHQQRDELTGSIRNLQAQLAGRDASAQLAARAAEFAERGNTMTRWSSGGRDNGVLPRAAGPRTGR